MREVQHTRFPPEFRDAFLVVNELVRGRTNALKRNVTLSPSSATTVIEDVRITTTSALFFSPKTANAAAALAGLYVSSVIVGEATLTHANNAQVDKTFDILIKSGEPT